MRAVWTGERYDLKFALKVFRSRQIPRRTGGRGRALDKFEALLEAKVFRGEEDIRFPGKVLGDSCGISRTMKFDWIGKASSVSDISSAKLKALSAEQSEVGLKIFPLGRKSRARVTIYEWFTAETCMT